MLTLIWDELLYKPLYNILIWLVSVMPGHDLGISIIILTLVIRGILYIPSMKGLRSQAAMQEIQPKLAALKTKYKSDPQKQAQETMKLYKENNVNPFGGCLTLIVQLPILLALFYVFRSGLSPENLHYLYAPLRSFDMGLINTMFLGVLNLVEITPLSRYVMPVIVGGLQFYQMRMMNEMNDKNKQPVNKDMPFDPQAPMKAMQYFLPVMVAFFAASYPAGLSLYWATGTVFSIGQQKMINKKKTDMLTVKAEEVEKKPVGASKSKKKKRQR